MPQKLVGSLFGSWLVSTQAVHLGYSKQPCTHAQELKHQDTFGCHSFARLATNSSWSNLSISLNFVTNSKTASKELPKTRKHDFRVQLQSLSASSRACRRRRSTARSLNITKLQQQTSTGNDESQGRFLGTQAMGRLVHVMPLGFFNASARRRALL